MCCDGHGQSSSSVSTHRCYYISSALSKGIQPTLTGSLSDGSGQCRLSTGAMEAGALQCSEVENSLTPAPNPETPTSGPNTHPSGQSEEAHPTEGGPATSLTPHSQHHNSAT